MNVNADTCLARNGWAAVLAAVTLSLAGCNLGLPQAQTDPTRTYVLASPAADAGQGATANAPVVRLRGVEIPSYLRARPIVVRRGENEVDYREYARWGEPLEQGIARLLREELVARGAAAAVQVSGAREAGPEPTLELTVRVVACEGMADGAVAFRARWELAAINGAELARGDYRAAGLQWTPRQEATLAAALSRAVAGLASEVAAALSKK